MADHVFYDSKKDYAYETPVDAKVYPLTWEGQKLRIPNIDVDHTYMLVIEIASHWLGKVFDPYVLINGQKYVFERSTQGKRWLNLTSSMVADIDRALSLTPHFCTVKNSAKLVSYQKPDLGNIMVIAPHSDDAEIAAFGLYQSVQNAMIVTLTQGEIEPQNFNELGLNTKDQARLKGRLRAWDSVFIPKWSGNHVKSVQLGYFCMRLSSMLKDLNKIIHSEVSGLSSTIEARQWNTYKLPGDNGVPTGENLLADLTQLLSEERPHTIVMPHPGVDAHHDHQAATYFVLMALQKIPSYLPNFLLYANHLSVTDAWPMGDAQLPMSPPPIFHPLPSFDWYSHELSKQTMMDKYVALSMQHDLKPKVSKKIQWRRRWQSWLLNRHWQQWDQNDYFRRSVRENELFWWCSFDQYHEILALCEGT